MATYRVRVKLPNPAGGGEAYNIWHVRTMDEGIGGDDALDDAITALSSFYSQVRTHLAEGTISVGDSVIKDPLNNPEYVNINPISVQASGSSYAPSLLAVTCTWYTSSATRSGRGRTFVGPWSLQSVQADGTVSATALGELRTAAAGLVADSKTANGWAIGVLSQKQRLFRDVTSYAVRDRFATMRSRRD